MPPHAPSSPRGRFELLLFTTDVRLVTAAVEAGVDGIVIDWERRGKRERQAYADTQINQDTPADLTRVRRATRAPILCRINGVGDTTPGEIDAAVGEGADEILVPMVRTVAEMETVFALVKGRCRVGMLIETVDAAAAASSFARLPLSRVYVGLNDLGIERGTQNIFTALADGTVDAVRASVRAPFGFGGLTVPDGGHPVPCRLLMGEMARLGASFSFLRRSFLRDARGQSMSIMIARMRLALAEAYGRAPADVAADRQALFEAVDGWTLPRAATR